MSLPAIILIIMLSGVAGGIINYLLPSNVNADGSKIRNTLVCVALGVGAAILVPLFLEFAQSKLMDNVHVSWQLQEKGCISDTAKTDSIVLNTSIPVDSVGKMAADSTRAINTSSNLKITNTVITANTSKPCTPLKNYFLFVGYCLVAAIAGIRFINNIIDNVVKEKQIEKLKEINNKVEGEKEKEKKAKEKLDKQNKLEASKEEQIVFQEAARGSDAVVRQVRAITPVLIPIIHPDDPQKGRFGGKNRNNGRLLSAKVEPAKNNRGYYQVTIWVESTEPERPLTDDVIIYLHDSFRPSIYTITPGEFINGKAEDNEIISYGAFTIGVITDQGQTLLELDLAEDKNFPEQFRNR